MQTSNPITNLSRMGARVVEGTGLENRQALTRLVGSNPTPSAILRQGFGWLAHFSHRCPGDFSALQEMDIIHGIGPPSPRLWRACQPKPRRRWRRERDSNPRRAFTLTPLAGERLQPLGHLSRALESAGNLTFPRGHGKRQNADSCRTAQEQKARLTQIRHRSFCSCSRHPGRGSVF